MISDSNRHEIGFAYDVRVRTYDTTSVKYALESTQHVVVVARQLDLARSASIICLILEKSDFTLAVLHIFNSDAWYERLHNDCKHPLEK